MTGLAAKRLTFGVPGDLATPTGGYAYDRRVIEELRRRGWHVDAIDLGEGFPHPQAAQLASACDALARTPTNVPIVVDGLAFGVMDDAASRLATSHVLVALVHHPLALETGLTAEEAEKFRRSERTALSAARHTITSSASTADRLVADYGVSRANLSVAPPGNDPMPLATPSTDGLCRLLSVGSIVPRKGYDVLIAALAELADLPWHLTIVGDKTRSPETTDALATAVLRAGLAAKVDLAGAVSDDALAAAYMHADVFVTASHFEGYGMAAATAIACGLPIVATTGGALSRTIGATGLLVAPGDAAALAADLRQIIEDKLLRARLRDASRTAAKMLPSWSDTATLFTATIESLA